jgi:hypothetical protein
LLRLLARLGFAAWFGAGLWFGAFGARSLFQALGGGVGAALAALFPSIFAFGVGAGLAALVATLGDRGGRRRTLRLWLAALLAASALTERLVLLRLVASAAPGSSGFAAAHLVSVLVALAGWAAALAGLVAT